MKSIKSKLLTPRMGYFLKNGITTLRISGNLLIKRLTDLFQIEIEYGFTLRLSFNVLK